MNQLAEFIRNNPPKIIDIFQKTFRCARCGKRATIPWKVPRDNQNLFGARCADKQGRGKVKGTVEDIDKYNNWQKYLRETSKLNNI